MCVRAGVCVSVCVAGEMPYYRGTPAWVQGWAPSGGGPVPEGCLMESIMTALAPLESRYPRLGQSLWWLWVMRPRCLHAHAAPAGVLFCPVGHPGEACPPSVSSSQRAGGGTTRSHRMCPHTQCVRHNGQDSTLALYTVTLHSRYALTVHCHCTLPLYTVTVNLGRFFLEGVDGNFSPPLCSPLTPPPPSYSQNPKNSCSHSESCDCSLRHSQGHTQ